MKILFNINEFNIYIIWTNGCKNFENEINEESWTGQKDV